MPTSDFILQNYSCYVIRRFFWLTVEIQIHFWGKTGVNWQKYKFFHLQYFYFYGKFPFEIKVCEGRGSEKVYTNLNVDNCGWAIVEANTDQRTCLHMSEYNIDNLWMWIFEHIVAGPLCDGWARSSY